jgi:ribosomal protein L11 methyltransferase
VLDLGTGNGMLSFAASLSFGCNIDARDLDANALANATENLTLNPGCKKITFRQGTLTASDPEGQFCLIMANIYAEVLVPLAPIFRRSLRQQGLLILSGVFDETIELVLHGFEKDFELVARLDENEWSGLLYRAA